MPYASILIPTHDRDATLALSVMSAQRQTVRDIEILIVGDGCTSAVRNVAQGLASNDPRVKFLDLPKAALRGAANRDHAIRTAASDRIFYNDDDDLLLPQHIERLGAKLDRWDVVDTPVASAQVDGNVALGIHDSAHEVFQSLLKASHYYKAVFDTHLAHRRSTYLHRPGWLRAKDRGVVLHLLTSFIEPPAANWITVFETTALSFHGMARTGAPAEARAAELRDWLSRTESTTAADAIRRSGSYAFHSFELATALAALDVETRAQTIRHLQGRLDDDSVTTYRQRKTFEFATALQSGATLDEELGPEFLDALLDGGLSPVYLVPRVLSVFQHTSLRGRLAHWLDACSPRPTVTLARFYLAATSGTPSNEEIDEIRSAMEGVPEWRRHFFGLAVSVALAHGGHFRSALDFLVTISDTIPPGRHAESYWQTREYVSLQLQLEKEVSEARRALTVAAASSV